MSRSSRTGWRLAAMLYVAFGSIGLWAAFRPTLRSGFAELQTDPGDTVFVAYVLEHLNQSLTRGDYVGEVWSPPFFYPAQGVLAYSEVLFGAFPIYGLLRAGLRADLAFQVWMMVMLGLTYASTLVLMRGLGIRPVVAVAGAYVFAFGATRVTHLNHPQLLASFFAPLCVLALLLWLRQPRRWLVPLLLAGVCAQLLAGFYVGWFLALGLAALAASYLAFDRAARRRCTQFVRVHWRFCLGSASAIGGALALVLWPQLRAALALGSRDTDTVSLFLLHAGSWLAPLPGTIYEGWWRGLPPDLRVAWEHRIFVGLLPLLGLAAAWCWLRRWAEPGPARTVVASSLMAMAILVVSTLRIDWPGEPALSAWSLVRHLPGGGAIRAVGRVWTIAYLLLLVAAGVGLEMWLRRFRPRMAALAALVVLPLLVREQWVAQPTSFPKATFFDEVARLRRLVGDDCSAAFVQIVPPRVFYQTQLAAMWAGMLDNVPVVNGYSGNFPPGYFDPSRPAAPETLAAWLTASGIEQPICYVE